MYVCHLKYDSAIFCLLEAALKIHLTQKSEGAHAPLVSMGMTPLSKNTPPQH